MAKVKKYECLICGYRVGTVSSMYSHLHVKHKVRKSKKYGGLRDRYKVVGADKATSPKNKLKRKNSNSYGGITASWIELKLRIPVVLPLYTEIVDARVVEDN